MRRGRAAFAARPLRIVSGAARAGAGRSGDRGHRAVEVAVRTVRVVQVPVDEVVDVIAVRHGGVATACAVHVAGLVPAAAVVRGALGRVLGAHGERVLLDGLAVLVVQMAVVQIVDVAVVSDAGVAAAAAVRVRVMGVRGRHDRVRVMEAELRSRRRAPAGDRGSAVLRRMAEHVGEQLAHVVVGERVEHVLAVAPGDDQPLALEQPEPL